MFIHNTIFSPILFLPVACIGPPVASTINFKAQHAVVAQLSAVHMHFGSSWYIVPVPDKRPCWPAPLYDAIEVLYQGT